MAEYATHRRAHFDYEILETFDAGLVLFGHEVKAIRKGRAKLEGGHVIVRGGEAFLVGISIAPYQAENTPKDYDPERPRKLLLAKKQIAELLAQSEKKGLTIVPLVVYNGARYLKLKLGVARGKKNYDKREKIQERDVSRDIERRLKNQKG